MSIRTWLRVPRVRRGLAASAVILAAPIAPGLWRGPCDFFGSARRFLFTQIEILPHDKRPNEIPRPTDNINNTHAPVQGVRFVVRADSQRRVLFSPNLHSHTYHHALRKPKLVLAV